MIYRLKRLLSYALVIAMILPLSLVVSYQKTPRALAETSDPTLTPTATLSPTVTSELTPTQSPSQWTFEKVELNKEYVDPQSSGVKLTFTKLPNPTGNIKIEEISLTKEQIEQTGSLSDKAYDITSDMADGTFTYNLFLPIPESSKGKAVEVKFAEELLNIGSAEKVENTLTKTDTSVSIKDLDHFTIYILTTPNPDTGQGLVINEILVHPAVGGKEFVEIYNTTNADINCSFGVSCRIADAAGAEHIFTNVVPAHGFYVFEHDQGWLNDTGPETVILKDYGNNEIDRVEIQAAGILGSIVDHYPLQGESLMRITDGNATWSYMLGYPTKGRTNVAGQPVVNNLYVSGMGANEKIYATFATNNATVSKCYLTTGYNPFTNDGMVEIPGAMHLSADGTTGYCYAEGVNLSGATEIGKIKVFIDYCTRGTCASIPSNTINLTSGTILDNTGPINVSLSYPTGLKNFLYTINNGMPINISNFSDSGVGGATEGTMIMESAPYLNGTCGTFAEVSNGSSTIFPNSFYPGPYSTIAGTYWYEKLNDGLCHRFNLSVADMFGNTTTYTGDTVMFDAQGPVMPNVTAGVRSNVLAYFAWDLITGDNSGINHYEYAFTGAQHDGILDSSWVSVSNTQDHVLADISGTLFVPNWLHMKAIDNAGNYGSGNVTFMDTDFTAPVITITNSDTSEAQSKTVTAVTDEGILTMSVNAAGVSTCDNSLTFAPYASTTFSLAVDNTRTICYKAVDVLGNTSYLLSNPISGIDSTPPVITIDSYNTAWTNGDITVTASTNEGTLNANFHQFTANGSFDFVATDAAGNVTTQTVTITNIDKTAPTITFPPQEVNPTIEATGLFTLFTFHPTVVDNVDPAPIFTSDTPTGSSFPLGSTTVTWTATDSAGNTATASQIITVRDTISPNITSPANITTEATSSAGAVVIFSPAATDITGTPTVTCDPASGSTFALGTRIVTCTATDSSGNQSVVTFNVTVHDTTPPAISSVANITREATSASGATVTFTNPTAIDLVDGNLIVVCSPASGSLFTLGVTTVNCSVMDRVSNSSGTSFTVSIVDTTAPTGSITSPSSGDYLRGTVSINANAADGSGSGVSRVEFYHNPPAPTYMGQDVSASYSFDWDTTSVSDGAHNIYIKVFDNAGNESGFISIPVIVDNTAPTASINIPNNYYGPNTYNIPTATINGLASDSGSGIDRVEMHISSNAGLPNPTWFDGCWDGGQWGGGCGTLGPWIVATYNSADGTWAYTGLPIISLASGFSYQITPVAYDVAGNGFAGQYDTFTWDDQKPVSQASALPASTASRSFNVNYTASDPVSPSWTSFSEKSGVKEADLYYRPESGSWTKYGTYNTGVAAVTVPSDGRYEFYTVATDNAGNVEDAPASYDSYTTVDTTAPTYTWDSPAVNSIYKDGQSIYVEASITETGSGITDGVSCNPAIHFPVGSFTGSVIYSAATGKCSGTITLADPLHNLGDGTHHITLSVADKAGNSTISADRNILIDNTAPVITVDSYTTSWTNQDIVVTASTNEGTLNTTSHTFTANGSFDFVVTDTAGNSTTTTVTIGNIDKTAPTMTASAQLYLPVGGSYTFGTWTNQGVAAFLNGSDGGSGFLHSRFCIDQTNSCVPNDFGPITFGSDGIWYLRFFGVDNAGNVSGTESREIKIDKTSPTTPIATPGAGDYMTDQLVALASSDSGSGVEAIYIYYTLNGDVPDSDIGTFYDGSSINITADTTLKAIAYDKVYNASSVLEAVYGIAPKISAQSSSAVTATTATITWTTDDLSTSRVIYDTVSHLTLGSAPNYGYAFSTTEDSSEVINHSVIISSLSAGTTYYFRVISHGSPEAVGDEQSFTTTTASSSATNVTTVTTQVTPARKIASSTGVSQNVTSTPAISSSPSVAGTNVITEPTSDNSVSTPEVKGTQTESNKSNAWLWWLIIAVIVLLGTGSYLWYRRNSASEV